MKLSRFLVATSLFAPAFTPLSQAENEEKESDAPEVEFAFQEDFEKLEAGDVPSDYFVIEGEWSIVKTDDENLALKVAEAPLVESQVQLGESLRDMGGTVRARVLADKKRRSSPRFGVGMHGMSGFRLRLVPAGNQLELVRSDEVAASTEITWTAGDWWMLELSVEPDDTGQWNVAGRAWPEDGERPEKPQIEFSEAEAKFSGKASVTATPYAGLPIFFDNIVVEKGASAPSEGE